MFTKKARRNARQNRNAGYRCLTEEMILREGIEEAKALRRGQSTIVRPVSTNSISSMKWELPETKYEYTTEPVNDAKTLFTVTIRRRTWLEERHAKKNPPHAQTCCFVCAADADWEPSNW